MNKTTLTSLYNDAVQAVMPDRVMPRFLRRNGDRLLVGEHEYVLSDFEHCYLCASGKAADAMAPAAADVLGEACHGGVVISPETSGATACYTHFTGTHPLPSQQSVDAGSAMHALFTKASRDDFILFLLSGGSSALMEMPIPPIHIDAFTATTQLLLENGYSIDEINTIRKHLSALKGGRLAASTEATVAVLVVSDVIGDDLHTIGSAPLYCDTSSYHDAVALLEAKSLFTALPKSVQDVLHSGLQGILPESPKTPMPHTRHFTIASNLQALQAAADAAKNAGLNVRLDPTPIQGDVSEAAETLMAIFDALPEHTLYLRGGECTVVVQGSGKGGRNQHLALLLMQKIKTAYPYGLIAAGTDGIDGNSDAAGAFASNGVYALATAQGIDPADALSLFDSNGFFTRLGATITTGYTRTNVMDVLLFYKGSCAH